MYIHGGGFVPSSAAAYEGYNSMLVKYSGCKVIAVDYALASEYSFPHGFNDCFNAFCQIIKLYPEAKTCFPFPFLEIMQIFLRPLLLAIIMKHCMLMQKHYTKNVNKRSLTSS